MRCSLATGFSFFTIEGALLGGRALDEEYEHGNYGLMIPTAVVICYLRSVSARAPRKA